MNSPSGHAFLCGKHTRKPIMGRLLCKVCTTCASWKKQMVKEGIDEETPAPEHHCLKNHDGSSGSMEAGACVDTVKTLHCDFHLNVRKMVMDDDASSRQATSVRWNNADWMLANPGLPLPQVPKKVGKNKGEPHDRPDKGNLPGETPEPHCVADPNHQRKQLTGDMIEFSKKLVEQRCTATKMDCKRTAKNFSHMVRSLPKMPKDKHADAAKAVLEHHFDNHKCCGQWCRRKPMTAEERKLSGRYCRHKENKDDSLLCAALETIVDGHIDETKLGEVAHGMDTNANESVNNLISYFAPKNRVCVITRSLQNGIGIAIGVLSLGFVPHFATLFKALGAEMTSNVHHFPETKDRRRNKRMATRKLVNK